MNSENVMFKFKSSMKLCWLNSYDFFKIQPYKYQDYERLKSIHNEHSLFRDDLFPASDSSIYKKQPVPSNVTWKRPLVRDVDDI